VTTLNETADKGFGNIAFDDVLHVDRCEYLGNFFRHLNLNFYCRIFNICNSMFQAVDYIDQRASSVCVNHHLRRAGRRATIDSKALTVGGGTDVSIGPSPSHLSIHDPFTSAIALEGLAS